ncbi:MAG TPA: TonB-dependent receptor [Rhizomicrobium sp.]|nr:TonB-dependent receptor [Rhizomicrobium sp.]
MAAIIATPAAAQSDQAPETVTVTASHLPSAVGQAAFSTVALSQDQLATYDQLDAALEQVPGVSLFRRTTSLSANPTTQGVSLRAIAPSAASRALVLLDGVPLNDPFGGWVIWSALPPEDIGGADIVRGAGSGPYGSGALTGTILLRERDSTDGISEADVSAGSLDTYRAGASGGTEWGPVKLFASGSAEHTNGWIPVEPDSRGPADNDVRFNAGSASLRGETDLGGGITATARVGYYDLLQGAGLVGAESTAQGETASLTVARKAEGDSIGWRVQTWLINSNLSNISVSTSNTPVLQASTTPADDQYKTPALGWGWNAAALGARGNFRWEAGADLRDDNGQSYELYSFSTALDHYLDARRSGGQSIVTGVYGEGAYESGAWLATLGARLDYWATSQGHLLQDVIASGTILTDTDYAGRDGTVPTGRAGLKYSFDDSDSEYLRVAAYAGFRTPTLNELYRPFRVGNVVTNANAALTPEKLDGVEVGWGGTTDIVTWSTTGFWNTLHDAVENATLTPSTCASGNGTCEEQRQNVGEIDALGLEAEANEAIASDFAFREAVAWTDARVHPGAAAPLLTGKRPAQAPGAVITAGAHWEPISPLSFDADLRWVSAQYEDDLNTIKLGSALTMDVRADWRFADGVSLYGKIDNALDAKVATGNTTGVINIGAPRIFEIGVEYAD